MKKILVSVAIFIFGFLFSQKHFIMFDATKDKIIYTDYKKRKHIEGFNIFINNKKYIKFLPSDIKSNYASSSLTNQKLISRIVLNQTVKEDNRNKKNKYIIVIKSQNIYRYYFVDHIFRTVID